MWKHWPKGNISYVSSNTSVHSVFLLSLGANWHDLSQSASALIDQQWMWMSAAAQSRVHRDRLGSIQAESSSKWNPVSYRRCFLPGIPRQGDLETLYQENLHWRLSTCPEWIVARSTTFGDEGRSKPSTLDDHQSCLNREKDSVRFPFSVRLCSICFVIHKDFQ